MDQTVQQGQFLWFIEHDIRQVFSLQLSFGITGFPEMLNDLLPESGIRIHDRLSRVIGIIYRYAKCLQNPGHC